MNNKEKKELSKVKVSKLKQNTKEEIEESYKKGIEYYEEVEKREG